MQTGYVLRDIAPPHLRAPVQETSDEALIEPHRRRRQARHAGALCTAQCAGVPLHPLRLTGNQSLAEDLVSEVFLDVWRQADGFEAKSPGLDLAARDRPLQGALGAAAPHRRASRRSDGGDHRGYRRRSGDRGRHEGPQHHRAEVPARSSRRRTARSSISSTITRSRSTRSRRSSACPPATVKTRMFYARSKMADLLKHAGVSAL